MNSSARARFAERLTSDLDGRLAPPRKNGELVFEHPWQSRAFGIAVALCQQRLYEWEEFRTRLIAEIIALGENSHGPASFAYYRCWAAALERLLVDMGICAATEIDNLVRSGRG